MAVDPDHLAILPLVQGHLCKPSVRHMVGDLELEANAFGAHSEFALKLHEFQPTITR
jgi:hypothetical protein